MIETYSDLVESVTRLLARNYLRGEVQTWIDFAEKHAVRKIRDLREIKYKTTGTLVSGTGSITLPEGIMGIDALQVDTVPIRILTSVTLQRLQARMSLSDTSGFPTMYTWTGHELIEIAPVPQTNDGYTVYFTKAMIKPDHLKYTSDILQEAPDLLLYGAAVHSAPFIHHDERLPMWQGLFKEAVDDYARFLSRKALTRIQVRPYGGGVHDHPQTTGTT